jgi:hypothetical protein
MARRQTKRPRRCLLCRWHTHTHTPSSKNESRCCACDSPLPGNHHKLDIRGWYILFFFCHTITGKRSRGKEKRRLRRWMTYTSRVLAAVCRVVWETLAPVVRVWKDRTTLLFISWEVRAWNKMAKLSLSHTHTHVLYVFYFIVIFLYDSSTETKSPNKINE